MADVERETKLRERYLRALEQEQFDLLPPGSYRRTFLRGYASFLGLDGDLRPAPVVVEMFVGGREACACSSELAHAAAEAAAELREPPAPTKEREHDHGGDE